MARKGKITIFLDEGVASSTIRYSSTGVIGNVPINLTAGNLKVNHAITGPSSDDVWKAVLDLVVAALV